MWFVRDRTKDKSDVAQRILMHTYLETHHDAKTAVQKDLFGWSFQTDSCTRHSSRLLVLYQR